MADWLALTNAAVDIPFAAVLAAVIMPVAVRLRRDFHTILTLIRAHALLHQVTRKRDPEGRIVATRPDYVAVHDVVADLFADGIGATVSPTVRETVAVVANLTRAGGETTNVAVARRLGLDKSAGQRRVRAAIHAGYLQAAKTVGLLLERGYAVTQETIRDWELRYAPSGAAARASPGTSTRPT
ncbi:MAG: hypothetical protein DK306_001867 [Chloroflexi bacterium]|nr:MAG: hypothetical protein DK306_001867 [Chloroflexota bacterium]